MPQPGMPSASGEDWMVRRLQDLERKVQELAAANVFGMTGIRPRDGGTDFEGFVNINGPAKITGTLDLPKGIIGNDALSAPISPATSRAENFSFSITPTNGEKTRVTIDVPAGYTQALVMATTTLSAYNSTATDDNIYASCRIQGVAAGTSPGTSVKTLYTGAVTDSASQLLTGIGSQIFVAGYASTYSGTWTAATASSIMNVSAMVLFLR